MPLFNKKKRESAVNGDGGQLNQDHSSSGSPGVTRVNGSQGPPNAPPPPYSPTPASPKNELPIQKPKLVFHCQQAQGSPTGIISGFTNIKELYQKISECYDFASSEILFCTLNTHKVDMARLLGGQIGLEDFIFVHRKGQNKEIEITKTEEALGLTITDNGAGYAFVKRIKEGSLMEKIGYIQVGDHIEKINEKSMIGCRHFEVAKALKEIPKGSLFTLRMVEPLKAGFSHIGPKSGSAGNKSKSFGSGKETLRFRAKGPATVEDAPDSVVEAATENINNLLESFMGINDAELAIQIWDMGKDATNPIDLLTEINSSDLQIFGFTDDFVFDIWGAISDAKSGRLKKQEQNTF